MEPAAKSAWEKSIGGDLERILFTEVQIREKIQEIGREITRDYLDRKPLLVGILNGCFPFMADLVRSIHDHIGVDFMSVSSYGGGMQSGGVVRILKDLNHGIQGRDVIIIEDIIDTGLTARYLRENLLTRHPASLELCALLDKREARVEEVPIRYVGFDCPDEFVVGYGLDYNGLYRNLPYVGILRKGNR